MVSLRRNSVILIILYICLCYGGHSFMWGWIHKPTWRQRIFKTVGKIAWCLGLFARVAKYAIGPVIVYLMVRYLT